VLVSHETIYRSLFIQTRGVLKKELMDHLQTKLWYLQRLAVKSQISSRSGKHPLKLRAALSLVIERFTERSHRESRRASSTLCDAGRSALKDTADVATALGQHIGTLRRSLTWDRGLEIAKHKDFAMGTDVQVYFCDPQFPGRGAPTKHQPAFTAIPSASNRPVWLFSSAAATECPWCVINSPWARQSTRRLRSGVRL